MSAPPPLARRSPPRGSAISTLAGLGTADTAFVLQGGAIVGVPAVLVYDASGLVEARFAARAGRT